MDCGKAILLVVITLTGVGDNLAVCSDEMPAPLAVRILEHDVFHRKPSLEDRNMRSNEKMKPFACSYHHDGSEWALTLYARDFEDARARCNKLGFLRVDGELIARIPARIGILARFACWLRNSF